MVLLLHVSIIIWLIILPAMDQDQQTYSMAANLQLSGLAWGEMCSCNLVYEWPSTNYSWRKRWQQNHQWLLDLWVHYQFVEKGTISLFCILSFFDCCSSFQLALPDIVTKRKHHSISALQLSPHNVLLVVFGGLESNDNDSSPISHTIIVELCKQ